MIGAGAHSVAQAWYGFVHPYPPRRHLLPICGRDRADRRDWQLEV